MRWIDPLLGDVVVRSGRYGFLDIGSHSARLLVVEVDAERHWRVVDEDRAILRLGDALASEGRLVAELERAQAVYQGLCQSARHLGVRESEAVGTAALRAARDGAAFAAQLGRQAGVPLTVLSGEEEARLGFLGATATLGVEGGYLCDLGGASTEVSRFSERKMLAASSAPFGAVTLHQQFLREDPPSQGQLQNAVAHVRTLLETSVPRPEPDLPLVALGGSFRSIAKLHQAATKYPFASLHNYRMAPDAIGQLALRLGRMSIRERRKVPGLAMHRAELVPSALLIAQAIVEHLAPSEIVISGAGLREGMLCRRLYGEAPPPADDLLGESCANLRFGLGEEPDAAETSLAQSLLSALAPLLPQARALALGREAAGLRGIGRRVNFYDRHRHTFAIVVGARLFGLSHREQVLLAAAASYEGPRRLREGLVPYLDLLERGDVVFAQRLGLATALAEALARSAPDRRGEVAADITPSLITLGIGGIAPPPQLPFGEIERLMLQFPKVYGRKLVARYS